MSKFSVKKPLSIFVAVIAVLVLGVVAYFKMTPDLLPNMDFPYVVVMTTYPGASPEKVEAEITKPLEQSMSTLEHIKEVTSTSSENVSMVMLEFEEAVNMDTIGVDIQQAIVTLSADWADTVGSPYVLKINPSMLPVEVAALSMEGKDTIALTEFLNDTLMNQLEGIPGVARISSTGMVEQQLHVVLDQKLIDKANEKVMAAINGELDEAAQELEDQREELESNQSQMDSAQSQLSAGADAMVQGQVQLQQEKDQLLAAQKEMEAAKPALESALSSLSSLQTQVESITAQQQAAQAGLSALQDMKAQEAAIAALQEKIAALQAEIAALEAAGGGPELAAKQTELVTLQAELAQQQAVYQASLAAAGLSPETLDGAIAQAEAGCKAAEEALVSIDQALAAYDTDRSGLSALVAETQAQLDQVNEGLRQMEQGLVSVEEAERMLEQQKLTGMLQLSTTAAKLAAGSSSLEMALGQIESGLETLEDSRSDALKEADLHEILTMELVSQILTAQNFTMPAGYVEQEGINYMVSVGEEITELDTLENLLILDLGMEGVEPIYLKDVAAVTMTDNSAETYAKLNGSDSVVLSFEKQSTYATAETTDNINVRFRELETEYPGLTFVSLMDQGDYIYMVVESILSNIFLGALFSVLILFLFLKDLRPTFVTLCSIPISVIFAIVLMYFSGVTLNMISLSGLSIAVGMLVDNSIVVIENIYRLREKGANAIQAAVSGARQVVGAVAASTLTTVCVFVPIVFVEGLTRQLFTDLALTMSYALLASLIVALTLVPAMASGMLRKEHKPRQGFMEKKVLPAYQSAVRWSLKHKAVVLLVSAVLLVVSVAAGLAKGFIFMPTMDSPTITVTLTMPEGSNMETTVEVADEALARIGDLEGIDTVGAMMGGGMNLAGAMGGSGVQTVSVYVTLSEETASGAAVAKEIEAVCADLDCTVNATSAMMDMSMLTGSGISLNLYGDDLDTLQAAARTAADTLAGLDGVSEVSDGLEEATPAFHVSVDRNAAMAHGLTIAQVYMEIAGGLTGEGTAATLELDGITTDVIIQKPTDAVLDAQALRDYVFEVTNREGETEEVPLKDIAQVEDTFSLETINRLSQRRYLTVSAMLEEGYNVTLLTEQAEQRMKEADLGEGVSYEFTGENEMIMEAMEQLLLMMVLGILLVYLIMVAQFQSLKAPFIVMFTIPLAFTGGFFALLLCGMEVSVIAMIGFIMLVGVIVNNGIVLVDYINQLRRDGVERREAIVEAGVTRMRPILMTTLTTVLGQLVMAVSQQVGAAMMRPIAIVSIGGLLYATVMTLFVVPCIYDILSKKELRKIREEDLELLDI